MIITREASVAAAEGKATSFNRRSRNRCRLRLGSRHRDSVDGNTPASGEWPGRNLPYAIFRERTGALCPRSTEVRPPFLS